MKKLHHGDPTIDAGAAQTHDTCTLTRTRDKSAVADPAGKWGLKSLNITIPEVNLILHRGDYSCSYYAFLRRQTRYTLRNLRSTSIPYLIHTF